MKQLIIFIIIIKRYDNSLETL